MRSLTTLALTVLLLTTTGLPTALAALSDVDPGRGVDPRVDYPSLARFGPWDDRNYRLTVEDLALLAPNEAELVLAIPAFFRVELRRAMPDLRREGPAQYPRSAPEVFRLMYGGLLVDGVVVGGERATTPDVPVEGEFVVGQGAETALAVHPSDDSRVIAGYNHDAGGQRMVYSTDGGESWVSAGTLPASCCDPTVAWSSDGSIAYTATLKSCSFSCGVSAYRSTDGGQTWGGEAVLTSTGSDKEFIHVDTHPTSPYRDNVYLTWHNSNVLQFARSTNLGVSWSTPVAFSSDAVGIGSDIATDSAGAIYYVWPGTDSRAIWVKKSTNGGQGFATAVSVAATQASFDWPIPAMESRRAWIYVAVDVDLSGGPHTDSIYASWTDTTAADGSVAADNHTQIHVATSRNGGATWTDAIPHPTADALTVDRFNQWLEVDARGVLHLVYYTTEWASSRTSVDLAYQYSQDGGATWTAPSRVTTATSPNISDSFEWGDYNGLDITATKVLPIWTDNRTETQRVDSVDVYTAHLTNETGTPDFYLAASGLTQDACAPGSVADIPVTVGVYQAFANPVTLTVADLPAGATGSVVGSPVAPPGAATAHISLAAGTATGAHPFRLVGSATASPGHELAGQVSVFSGVAAAVTPLTPPAGTIGVATQPTFSWTAAGNAAGYHLQVATDAAFAGLLVDVADLAVTSYSPAEPLPAATQLYWRVRATSPCGDSAWTSTSPFVTLSAPGECLPWQGVVDLYFDDLESGATGFTTAGTASTWALSTARAHSGTTSFHAGDGPVQSDQRLMAPAVAVPADASAPALELNSWHDIEAYQGGCFDGGVVEVSTNGGSAWTRLTPETTSDPYDGTILATYGNPLGGSSAWCGVQGWTRVVVDLAPFAGQTVSVRLRLATDQYLTKEGWYVDDVRVTTCSGGEPALFADGFESGGATAWSASQP